MAQRVKIPASFSASTGYVAVPTSAKLTATVGLAAVRIESREYITMEHLWTARNAARLCGEPEPQPPPIQPNVAHRSLAMTAIIFSAAFLEALVNEVILDVIEPPQGKPSTRVEGIPISTATTPFKQLWRNERKLGPLGKYQAALKAVNKKPYKETLKQVGPGNRTTVLFHLEPARSAKLLFELRNHFMHFKPETRDIDIEHDYAKRLKKAKAFGSQQHSLGHPNQALGADLAQWACDSSAKFAKSWWARMGLRRSFDAAFDQLGPY